MSRVYKIKINGDFYQRVIGNEDLSLDQVRAFVAAQYNDLSDMDVVEFSPEAVAPDAEIMPFRVSSYMQVADYAIDIQLKNLVLTYGKDHVIKYIEDVFGLKKAG